MRLCVRAQAARVPVVCVFYFCLVYFCLHYFFFCVRCSVCVACASVLHARACVCMQACCARARKLHQCSLCAFAFHVVFFFNVLILFTLLFSFVCDVVCVARTVV